MRKFYTWLIRNRIGALIVFGLLAVISAILFPMVQINYDMAAYLPSDAPTHKALEILKNEFSVPGQADVMLRQASIAQTQQMKAAIAAIPGIDQVIWLDDLADVRVPLEQIPQAARDNYYLDSKPRLQVLFTESDYSQRTNQALSQIRELIGDAGVVTGEAVDAQHMQALVISQLGLVIAIVVPLVILILLLTTTAWIEPAIYLGTMGIAILYNLGTNVFFPNISFLTHSTVAILQLAVSMDYALFLSHRYREERSHGHSVEEAVIRASISSWSSVAASCLTTVAGFLALIFMRYTIGSDLGFVMAKGVILSLLCVMLLMPLLLVLSAKLIEKTEHRDFIASFKRFGKGVVRGRVAILLVLVAVLVPAILSQSRVSYAFGSTSGIVGDKQLASDRQEVERIYGVNNPIIVLVPSGDPAREKLLADALEADPDAFGVQSLATLADPQIPRAMLPQAVIDQFDSGHHARIVLQLRTKDESPQMFAAVTRLEQIAEQYYPDQWLMAGMSSSIADIRNTVTQDQSIVNLMSMLAVAIIILFTFRSLSLPVLLIAVIQSSIWLNVSVVYLMGSTLVFIGYLIVSSLQLGATIDYAILMTQRYIDHRKLMSPRDAAVEAVRLSAPSIMVSAVILSVAGFGLGVLSHIQAIADIGNLIGRGALFSGLLVLVALPGLLALADPLIRVTTLGSKKFLRKGQKPPAAPVAESTTQVSTKGGSPQ